MRKFIFLYQDITSLSLSLTLHDYLKEHLNEKSAFELNILKIKMLSLLSSTKKKYIKKMSRDTHVIYYYENRVTIFFTKFVDFRDLKIILLNYKNLENYDFIKLIHFEKKKKLWIGDFKNDSSPSPEHFLLLEKKWEDHSYKNFAFVLESTIK